MSDGGGGGSSGGGSSKGGGESPVGFTPPALGGPTTAAEMITGGSSTPLIPIAGGSFGANDGTTPLSPATGAGGGDPTTAQGSAVSAPPGITGSTGGDPMAGFSFSAPPPQLPALGTPGPTSSLASPQGVTSPVGATTAPTTTAGAGAAPTGIADTTDLSAKTAAAKPTGASGTSVLDSLGIKNPLGAAIGAAGLGYSVLQGQQAPKFSPELQAQAARLDANGQKLMEYLQSGNLPPGLKTSLDQATAAAKAKIVSNFAAQGLNTDPNQNSVLAQQLAQVDQQAIISTAQIGQQLMQTGLAESGLSSDLYKTLANIDQTQTANIGKAIASFASAISGSGGGINLKVA